MSNPHPAPASSTDKKRPFEANGDDEPAPKVAKVVTDEGKECKRAIALLLHKHNVGQKIEEELTTLKLDAIARKEVASILQNKNLPYFSGRLALIEQYVMKDNQARRDQEERDIQEKQEQMAEEEKLAAEKLRVRREKRKQRANEAAKRRQERKEAEQILKQEEQAMKADIK